MITRDTRLWQIYSYLTICYRCCQWSPVVTLTGHLPQFNSAAHIFTLQRKHSPLVWLPCPNGPPSVISPWDWDKRVILSIFTDIADWQFSINQNKSLKLNKTCTAHLPLPQTRCTLDDFKADLAPVFKWSESVTKCKFTIFVYLHIWSCKILCVTLNLVCIWKRCVLKS